MESTHETPVRKFRGKAAILKVLQQQAGSGQSIKSFCLANGIATGTFHNWKARYSTSSDHSGFATVQIVPDTGLFASVGAIKIYQPVSAAYLKELLP